MAFTKITNAGFGLTTGTLVGVAASFSSTVSVGGTLTYEDVTNVDSVGLITARSGISITGGDLTVPDAIIHTDDTNTRIRFPTADTFSVETAGNERLRVSSGGDMGLGTASPTARLDVRRDDADGLIAEFHQSSGYGINIKSSQTVATIQAEANQALTFETGSSATERLRITSDGKMGLGTASPAYNLSVESTSGTSINIKAGTSSTARLRFGDSDDDDIGQIMYDNGGNSMRFHTNASERMRIDSSGNMGLGTASPSALLHISKQVNSGDVGLIIQNTGTSNNTVSIRLNKGSGTEPDHRIQNDTGGNLTIARGTDESSYTEQMRIDSSGRVLIGTSSAVSSISGNNVQSVHTAGSSLLLGRDDTSVASGNLIGAVRFFANDPSGYNQVAKITCDSDGAHDTDDYPSRLEFHTTSAGASSESERLRIHAAGHGEFFSGAVTRVVVADDVTVTGANQTVSGIPSWATKITIIFYRISLSGSTDFLVQLRASGSDIDSNYNSASANDTGSVNDTSTSGFIITNTNGSHKTSGRMVIERVGTDTKWVETHTVITDGGTPRHGAGDLSSYSGTIDGIKLKDTGSNLLDNGTITVIAEA